MVESILSNFKKIAKENPLKIVFPEGGDLRVLRAARILFDEGFARPVILQGALAKKLLAENNISSAGLEILDFDDIDLDRYANLLFELRKHKGLLFDDAKKLVRDVNYLGVLLVKDGFASGMVSGAAHPTSSVLRPALQIIKTKEGINTASSFFLMSRDDSSYLFSDCALIINPSASQLADIALSTASSARVLGIEPRVALLSFSTLGSANDDSLNKIREALVLIKKSSPDLVVDGEVQVDAAIVPEVAKSKCSESILGGRANVLIFPDLNSGNISYKLVERLGGFKAIGPIVQGLNMPVNDLSRGCSVDDIVNLAVITVVEAQR